MQNPLDPAELTAAMNDVHCAGVPGVSAEVRDGDRVRRGASGVAEYLPYADPPFKVFPSLPALYRQAMRGNGNAQAEQAAGR